MNCSSGGLAVRARRPEGTRLPRPAPALSSALQTPPPRRTLLGRPCRSGRNDLGGFSRSDFPHGPTPLRRIPPENRGWLRPPQYRRARSEHPRGTFTCRTCAKISKEFPRHSPTMERVEGRPRDGRRFGLTFSVLGIAVLVGCLSITSVVAAGGAGNVRAPGSLTTLRAVSEYVVTFSETGLPSGTSWSVTLNGTVQNSTTPSMDFMEPNGTYLFLVGSVPGYTVGPEGNLTVQGAPASATIAFVSTVPPPQTCGNFHWANTNDTLLGNCNGFFEVDYRAFEAATGWTTDNLTLTVGPLAEVTASGAVAALTVPESQGMGSVNVTSTPSEVNLTDVIIENVTNAIGLNSTTLQPNGQTPQWDPHDLPGGGSSTTWGNGNQVLGNTTLGVVFHFENGSGNASNRIKIDVTVSAWPWMNTTDVLGLEVVAQAFSEPSGVRFSYAAATDTITQEWNSTGVALSSLSFGPTANTTGNSSSPLTITDQVGLFPGGNQEASSADALLTFVGPGGFSGLKYDPWLVFGAQVPTSTVPPPASAAALPLVAIGSVALAGALLGGIAYQLRRRPIDEGLTPAG